VTRATQTALALAADTEPLERWCAEHADKACAVAEQTAKAWPHLPPLELSERLRLRLQLIVSLGADRALAALGVA
jgi:hypothetical protein